MTKDEQWLLDEKYHGKVTERFKADKERLALGEPLAYVIGSQPFLGLTIFLDSHPLIPRSETEWWADQMLESELADPKMGVRLGLAARSAPIFGSASSRFKFLDLCAGSGAIGCAALLKLPNAEVYFGEIDPAHKTTIQKNILENNLDTSRADIRIGDLFEPFDDMTFDIIAINPPYIPSGRELPPSVVNHEPALALFAGDDGLDVMRHIAAEISHYLAKHGVAWIECDSAHAAAACALFTEQGFKTEIRTDQYDVPRIIVVSFS